MSDPERLFSFVQFEFPRDLGPADGRYVVREETGTDIGLHTAALSYDAQFGRWTRRVVRFLRRLQTATTRPLVISARRIARALKASSLGSQ